MLSSCHVTLYTLRAKSKHASEKASHRWVEVLVVSVLNLEET